VTATDGILALREIIDIREQDEFTLNLPYLIPQPYLSNCISETVASTSGQLDIIVLNDLMAPETCAQSIQLLFFFKAGPDFEFQVPGGSLPSFTQAPGYFAAQAAQTDILVNEGIAQSKIQPLSTVHSSTCIGEHFVSIKQLLSRFSQYVNFTGAAFPAITNFAFYPWMYSCGTMVAASGALTAGTWGGTAGDILCPMYLYQRGSQKLCFGNQSGLHVTAACITQFFRMHSWASQMWNSPAPLISDANNPLTAAAWPPANTYVPMCGLNVNDIGPGLHVVSLPYYSRFPVSFIPVLDQTLNASPASSTVLSETLVQSTAWFGANAAFANSATISRAFGDDFQLSFFICAPPILISYV
jgi:hypothetical protein